MIRFTKVILSVAIMGSLFRCTYSKEEKSNINDLPQYLDGNDSEYLVNEEGERIDLVSFQTEDGQKTVQKIEKYADDLSFRLEKISPAIYLTKNGLNGEEFEKALNETSTELIFYFHINSNLSEQSVSDLYSSDEQGFANYLSFDIYQDFQLITNDGDSLSADYSMYVNDGGLESSEKVSIFFSSVQQNEEFRILYQDSFFGKGDFSFSFASNEKIKNLNNPT